MWFQIEEHQRTTSWNIQLGNIHMS